MLQTTLCFLLRDAPEKTILLGMKKRGFTAGRWNGFGGKIHENETPVQAAIREVYEEIGVQIHESELAKVAELTFLSILNAKGDPSDTFIHVFIAKNWEGIPKETEEMKPEWFAVNNIPIGGMWPETPFWLPNIINGEKLKAEFTFNNDVNTLLEKKVQIIENL